MVGLGRAMGIGGQFSGLATYFDTKLAAKWSDISFVTAGKDVTIDVFRVAGVVPVTFGGVEL